MFNFEIWELQACYKSELVYIFQVIKVADFGVARVQAQSGVMTAETGTYRWMAPEVAFSFSHAVLVVSILSLLFYINNAIVR